MNKWTLGQIGKTKPIQTQFKPNSKPIQTQTKPIYSELVEPISEAKNTAAFNN